MVHWDHDGFRITTKIIVQAGHGTRKGERRAKLTDEQVRQMRREYAVGGVSYEAIAKRYDIGKTPATRIIRRETYRHVSEG